MTGPADALRPLLDRQEIVELCCRYATALDAKDWVGLRSCFTADPVFVHPGGRLAGADAIVARSREALGPLDVTHHLIGTVVVEVDGDQARARCYFQAQHVRRQAPGGDTYVIAGRYADRLVRLDEGWRIAERQQTYLWRDGNRAVVTRPPQTGPVR
jgi:3-phenylpropionate/cinnamic acid dioxygenase small subunit